MSMRIATSTMYDNQISAIDNLSAQYELVGQQLSSGISLTAPGDDPQVVAQDLTLSGTLAAENGDVSNMSAAQNQLNFVDSTLSTLTDILQQAQSLAVQSANDLIPNTSQREAQGTQLEGMLEEVVSLANSQYGGQYVFAGTASGAEPPIVAQGDPPNAFSFTGNNQTQYETINGESIPVGVTMQQAFNVDSPDGTPSVFQVLSNLRDTMQNGTVVDQSGEAVNAAGSYITTNTLLSQLESGAPALSNVPLQTDSSGDVSIEVSGTDPATGDSTSNVLTFDPATTTIGDVLSAINTSDPPLGIDATWNAQEQRLVLTSTAGPSGTATFQLADTPSSGATDTGNFLEVFGLEGTADVVTDLSTQLGDIDNVLNSVLQTRANIGTQLQSLASQSTQLSSLITDNTNIQAGYQDTNVASATSRFTQLQTALEGAYTVTTRLESRTLLDYLT